MADQNEQSMFTPSGGMNQDDSIITPAPGSESGNSLFQVGDYKYALNMRIGSSRFDSFGDGEHIKDTSEVTDYITYGSLVTNPDFVGSLAPWLHTAGSTPWLYSTNRAIIIGALSGAIVSNVMYQPVGSYDNKVTISFRYQIIEGFTSGVSLSAVFMNGSSVLSSVKINSDGVNTYEEKTLTLSLPENCTGVGIRLEGIAGGPTHLDLEYFRINGYSLSSKPDGDERTIGIFEDVEFQREYYAVYNSSGNHSIRYFDPLQNVVFELLRWTGLKFEENSFVKFAKLDNWMAFTDRINTPRLINTDEIGELFIALGDAEFREFHISFHKWAPTMPPITRAYYDGVTNNRAKIEGKVYQWAYRYVYKGNLKSRFSPTSVANNKPTLSSGTNIAPPSITAIELFIPGILYNNPDSGSQYNYFNHSDPKFVAAVQAIEIVYREGETDLWRLFKTLDNRGTFDNVVRFYGEANSTPISEIDFYQLFDTVPLLAGTVDSIDNRFVFGDCLDEDEPSIRPIVTNIGVVRRSMITTNDNWNLVIPAFTGMSALDAQELAKRNSITDHTFKSRGRYKVGIVFSDSKGRVSGTYTNDEWSYLVPNEKKVEEGGYGLTFKLSPNFIPPKWAVSYQIVRTNCLNIDYFMFGLFNKATVLIDNVAAALNDVTTLSQDMKNRISQHFENSGIVEGYEFSQKVDEVQSARINPFVGNGLVTRDSAGKYFFDTSPNRDKSLNRYLLSNKIAPKLVMQMRETIQATVMANGSRLYFDINNWYNASKKDASGLVDNPMNNLFYNFRHGDRVRFVGSAVVNPTEEQKAVYDELILEFTGKAIICKKPDDLAWVATSNGSNFILEDATIEVYTPKDSDSADYIFYETGEWYPILFPGTNQRTWSKSDWTYTNNDGITCIEYGAVRVYSRIPFSLGDCTMMGKTNYRDLGLGGGQVKTVNSPCMTNLRSQTYGYWDRGNGRPSISYSNYPIAKFKPTQVRFGGKIIEESFVNNLNNFREEDQFIYPSEYGRIRDLVNVTNAQVESVGSIFLAIGERETWSIYVNRTTIEDLSGNTQIALSNKVLGSFNALVGSFGTLNPESISKKRGRVYYWDAINGSWIRYSRDGLTAISDNKMRNWFKEIGDLLMTKYITDEIPRVISEFDPFNDELVTRIDHSSLPESFRGYSDYKGTIFSEADTRWKGCHSYNPERFAKIGNLFIGFVNGNVFLHERGPDYGTFYGVKYPVKIEPVFNPLQIMVKSWQTLAVVATDPWMAERIISEYRGQKTIQQSNIPLTMFEDQEDTYWAPMQNDENTPNTVNPIIEGQKMRSKAIQVLLTLAPDVIHRSLLHYVSAGYIESPKNPVN
jgi:hypothetical protein